jgi:hypothetical protein
MYRLLFPAVLLALVAGVPASVTQGAKGKEDAKKTDSKKGEPKKAADDEIEWKTAELFKRLESEFDLKVKSSFVNGFKLDGEEVKGKHLRLLLTFKKDVDAKEWAARGLPFAWGATDDGPYLEFFYFDDENVRILAQKHTNVIVDGDITRKKGEAFRVYIPLAEDSYLDRTKRVEIRLHTAKKKGSSKAPD